MPGGYKNIKSSDGKPFSTENQPERRRGKGWQATINNLLPEDQFLDFDDYEIVTKQRTVPGKRKGTTRIEKYKVARIKMSTKELLILVAIRKAQSGDLKALEMLMKYSGAQKTKPAEGIDETGSSDIQQIIGMIVK